MSDDPMTWKKMLLVLAVVGTPVIILNAPWIFLYLALFFRDNNYWTTEGCTRVIQGSIASPNGHMDAKIFHIRCGPVLIGNGSWSILALALVKHDDDPSRYVTAMEVNLGEDGHELAPWYPNMVWKNAREIQVQLPEDVEVWLKKPPVAGINIEIQREAGKHVRQFSGN